MNLDNLKRKYEGEQKTTKKHYKHLNWKCKLKMNTIMIIMMLIDDFFIFQMN